MPVIWHVSDLHGRLDRYEKLWKRLRYNPPDALLLGGDLLPGGSMLRGADADSFIVDILAPGFAAAREALGERYPLTLAIMGNDDPRCFEAELVESGAGGLWTVLHKRKLDALGHTFYGYPYVNPTPFQLKDWERWDVSRFVDVGCVPPTAGRRTVPADPRFIDWRTIRKDLNDLAGNDNLDHAVMLFHAPPHDTPLDRGDLDGVTVDHAPVDPHVGSIAIREFIEQRQPLVTLHGHVHESARLTGQWRMTTGRTHSFTAAHDGPELAIVVIPLDDPARATRELL